MKPTVLAVIAVPQLSAVLLIGMVRNMRESQLCQVHNSVPKCSLKQTFARGAVGLRIWARSDERVQN